MTQIMEDVLEVCAMLEADSMPPGYGDDLGKFDAAEFLDAVVDIEVHASWNGNYRGAAVKFCTGGPCIEIDTRLAVVTGWDGTDCYSAPLSGLARLRVESMDELISDMYANR